MSIQKTELIVSRRHRIPFADQPADAAGDSAGLALQLDAALMSAGWKMSAEALHRVSLLPAGWSMDVAVKVLNAVKKAVGAHSVHNVYFRDFPKNVPDTAEFWANLFVQTVMAGAEVEVFRTTRGFRLHGLPEETFVINLLKLPGYGSYQHTYDEMVAAHDKLTDSAKDRLTILHAGGTVGTELLLLTRDLAESPVPLPAEDLVLLRSLAEASDYCALKTARDIAVRENKAIINAARVRQGLPVWADTATDVLRLAAELSGGDVTLQEPVKFKSLPRAQRRALTDALDVLPESKLADVTAYREPWKRLGALLHPYERRLPGESMTQRVFAVARGDERVPGLMAKVHSVMPGQPVIAADLLTQRPGQLARSLDWLLRSCGEDSTNDAQIILNDLHRVGEKLSGRVLLSAIEHFGNRGNRSSLARVFTNRKGKAWVAPEERDALQPAIRLAAIEMLNSMITPRIRELTGTRVVVDEAALGIALPLSLKSAVPGLGILPRGSVTLVEHDTVSVFVHWMQKEHQTDYDLSVALFGQDFTPAGHVSWTSYYAAGAVYSGDITSAPAPLGATEIISMSLKHVSAFHAVPSINIYAGEDFDEVAEVYAGYMARDASQAGLPFEPRTVRAKSDLRGSGRIAMPFTVMRGEDGRWRVKWLHLYLKGYRSINVVEDNRVSAGLLARAITEREYLDVRWLAARAAEGGAAVIWERDWNAVSRVLPVTYIGLSEPEGLPEGSKVITPRNLSALIPE